MKSAKDKYDPLRLDAHDPSNPLGVVTDVVEGADGVVAVVKLFREVEGPPSSLDFSALSSALSRELDYEWGCDHCRNDGRLTSLNTCPFCDAQFDEP